MSDLASAYLEEICNAFQRELRAQAKGDKKHPGFDNAAMIWFVKAWSKIVLEIKGPGYWKPPALYLQRRNLPMIITKTWNYYKEADRAVGTFSDYYDRWSESRQKDNSDSTNPMNLDVYNRTDKAMMDLIYYHSLDFVGDAPNVRKDFRNQLTAWANQPVDKQKATIVFNMDRSL